MKYIALLILVIPAVILGVGIKLLRDTVFGVQLDLFPNIYLQLIISLLCIVFGIWFLGGYFFHRENKFEQQNNQSNKTKK